MAADDLSRGVSNLNMEAGPSKPRPVAVPATSSKPKAKPTPTPKPKPESQPYKPSSNSDPANEEQTAVHDVYEAIAPHFSLTRSKPWPFIASYLSDIPPGSIGLDSGAGNGKYIPVARAAGAEMIPMDRSEGLLGFAKGIPAFYNGRGEEGEYWKSSEEGKRAKGEAVRGDLTARCWRQTFDFAISIAAIHHLSTPVRRADSIGAILSGLRHSSRGPYASFLLYVWAYEQGKLSKRNIGAQSKRSQKSVKAALRDARTATGVLGAAGAGSEAEDGDSIETKGDGAGHTPGESQAAAAEPDQEPEAEEKVQDLLVPWVLRADVAAASKKNAGAEAGHAELDQDQQQQQQQQQPAEDKVFHRYYHLFLDGELQDLVQAAAEREGYDYLGLHMGAQDEAPVRVRRTTAGDGGKKKWLRLTGLGWEMDNWWAMGQVGEYEG